MRFLPVLLTVLMLPIGANAKMAVSNNCTINQNASVNISFNYIESDLGLIESKIDGKIKSLKALAKEIGIEKFSLTAKSYNVNPQSEDMQQYNVSGNVSFNILPIDKAAVFIAKASKNGFRPNLNVYSNYNGGDCSEAGAAISE